MNYKREQRAEFRVRFSGTEESHPAIKIALALLDDLDELDGNQKGLEGFNEFWAMIPKYKKKSRGQAEKAWKAIRPNAEQRASIMAGLKNAIESAEWAKANGEYIPHPATWLRAKGWLDEYMPLGRAGKTGGVRPRRLASDICKEQEQA